MRMEGMYGPSRSFLKNIEKLVVCRIHVHAFIMRSAHDASILHTFS
jgi:hypothetical protein